MGGGRRGVSSGEGGGSRGGAGAGRRGKGGGKREEGSLLEREGAPLWSMKLVGMNCAFFVLVAMLWNRVGWNMSHIVLVTIFWQCFHVLLFTSLPHVLACQSRPSAEVWCSCFAHEFCANTRLALKLVSRARTSCLCAEAVVAQSLFLCPVCDTSISHLITCTAVFSISQKCSGRCLISRLRVFIMVGRK